MDAALASVVGGLVAAPVIGVPTSDRLRRGVRRRRPRCSRCSTRARPALAVVNIDDGFGAGTIAARIARAAGGARVIRCLHRLRRRRRGRHAARRRCWTPAPTSTRSREALAGARRRRPRARRPSASSGTGSRARTSTSSRRPSSRTATGATIRALIDAAGLPDAGARASARGVQAARARRGRDPRHRAGGGALPRGRRRRRDRRGLRRRARARGARRRRASSARRCRRRAGFVAPPTGACRCPRPRRSSCCAGRAALRRRGRGRARDADRRGARRGARRRVRRRCPAMRWSAIGYGAGTRDARRACRTSSASIVGEPSRAPPAATVSLIEANLDDLLPELVPDAAAALLRGRRARRLDGARADEEGPARASCCPRSPGRRDERAVAGAMLRETSTLGVRIARCDRCELERESAPSKSPAGRCASRSAGSTARSSTSRRSTTTARALAARHRPPGEDRLGAARSPPPHEAEPMARRPLSSAPSSSARIAALGSAVVAFSGGVDSSLVAALAARALGPRALAVTAVSPALATASSTARARVAAAIGIAHETITTDELARDGYRRERPRPLLPLQVRALRRARRARRRRGYARAALGRQRRRRRRLAARPARRRRARRRPPAARGRRRRRRRCASSRATLGVPSAEKPASPCLASRIPYGTPVDPDDARQDRPRRAGRARARLPRAARPPPRRPRASSSCGGRARARARAERRAEIVAAIRSAGYARAAIDLRAVPVGKPRRRRSAGGRCRRRGQIAASAAAAACGSAAG